MERIEGNLGNKKSKKLLLSFCNLNFDKLQQQEHNNKKKIFT